MPVNTQPADTTLHADTVEAYYAPQYLDGFPDTVAGDSALGDINTLPVMEQPPRGQAQPFTRSPLHDTPSMALLLTGLLAVALSYHTGYKYIENFFHHMFSTRRRENLFEDHTVNETTILFALIANTCITEGFLIYFAIQQLVPAFATSLQASVFPHVATYCGLAADFYIAQWMVYKVLGYTFSDKVGRAERIANYPGLPMVTGAEMNDTFRRQCEELNISIEDRMVTAIMKFGDHYALTAGSDAAILTRLYHCRDHDGRGAKHDIAAAGLGEVLLQFFHEGLNTGNQLVHLPVAGDNGLAVFSVHLIKTPLLV